MGKKNQIVRIVKTKTFFNRRYNLLPLLKQLIRWMLKNKLTSVENIYVSSSELGKHLTIYYDN